MTVLQELAADLRASGGLLADATVDPPPDATTLSVREDYALLTEAIREGYLQHAGQGRVLRDDDPDLALLAGDHLYALGLARLAQIGDLDAIGTLAEAIARCARALAEDDPAAAEAAWEWATSRL